MEDIELKLNVKGFGHFYINENNERLGEMEVSISATNLTVYTTLEHGLQAGTPVYLRFNDAGGVPTGQYNVNSVPTTTRFTVIVPDSPNGSDNNLTTLPLVNPSLTRIARVVELSRVPRS